MSSSSGTIEISGTSDARGARAPRRVGVARAAGAFLLVASALTACDAGRLTGPAALTGGGAAVPTGTGFTPTLLEVVEPVAGEPADPSVRIESFEINRCNGDEVPVRGHVSFRLEAPTDLVSHFKFHSHWVVDGESLVTANVYHGSAQYMEQITTPFPGMTWTQNHEIRMTSRTAPDMRMKFLFHVTINHNGVPTARVEKGPTVDCNY